MMETVHQSFHRQTISRHLAASLCMTFWLTSLLFQLQSMFENNPTVKTIFNVNRGDMLTVMAPVNSKTFELVPQLLIEVLWKSSNGRF